MHNITDNIIDTLPQRKKTLFSDVLLSTTTEMQKKFLIVFFHSFLSITFLREKKKIFFHVISYFALRRVDKNN